jgi:hypothetical protein
MKLNDVISATHQIFKGPVFVNPNEPDGPGLALAGLPRYVI